jgi:hypothetical protein
MAAHKRAVLWAMVHGEQHAVARRRATARALIGAENPLNVAPGGRHCTTLLLPSVDPPIGAPSGSGRPAVGIPRRWSSARIAR